MPDYTQILQAVSWNEQGLVPAIAQDFVLWHRPHDGLDE